MTHYCIFNENEASTIIVYVDKDGEECVRPLCASCYDAYSMGERLATEHVPVEEFDADDYEDDDEEDEEGDFGDDDEEPEGDEDDE